MVFMSFYTGTTPFNSHNISTISCWIKGREIRSNWFAHFFEHLLFEGTKNVSGQVWFNIVTSNGGSTAAYTTDDFTCAMKISLQII